MTALIQRPEFTDYLEVWQTCRDCNRGENHIKKHRTRYLPATHSMILDGYGKPDPSNRGNCNYRNYLMRAKFPHKMQDAVKFYLGLLWHKPPTIEVPKSMEPILTNATRRGESIMQLLRKMHEEILTTGRIGLLSDMPAAPLPGKEIPYIQIYIAEEIINWDEGQFDFDRDTLNLVVLNESRQVRQDSFAWENKFRHRYLVLGDPVENEKRGVYRAGVFTDNAEFDIKQTITPNYRGNTLDFIPFVFVSPSDLEPGIQPPPMEKLASLDLTIYRGDADYRQIIHNQANPTLVVIGQEEQGEIRTGAGAVLYCPNPGSDAKYVCAPGDSLAEVRQSLENDEREAALASGALTDSRSNQTESGDAKDKRMQGNSVSLKTIALNCAEGLQTALRHIAIWTGEDPEQVIVKPNVEFGFKNLAPRDIVDLQTAKTLGAPISQETVHDQMTRAGLTVLPLEDEISNIDAEEPLIDEPETDGSGDQQEPNGGTRGSSDV